MNPIALGYAAVFVGSQLGGIALATTVVKKVLPTKRQIQTSYSVPGTALDMLMSKGHFDTLA